MLRSFLAGLALPVFLVLASGPLRAQEDDPHQQLERDTFALINAYRAAEQLPSFSWSPEAAAAARSHSLDMATGAVDFGHEGFRDRVRLLRNQLPGLRGCGENVLMTSDPHDLARSAVALWLKSPPHRHNIRGDFNLSGVGVSVSSSGVIYFTQIFVKVPPPESEGDGN